MKFQFDETCEVFILIVEHNSHNFSLEFNFFVITILCSSRHDKL